MKSLEPFLKNNCVYLFIGHARSWPLRGLFCSRARWGPLARRAGFGFGGAPWCGAPAPGRCLGRFQLPGSGAQAQPVWRARLVAPWGLLGPGTEPVFRALAGRVFTLDQGSP